MMSPEYIRSLARKAARDSRATGTLPIVAVKDGELPGLVPFIGDRRPRGWRKVGDDLFVDSSGWGAAGESALTQDQFLAQVKAGKGYAVTEAGQFQVYVSVFDPPKSYTSSASR